MGATARLLLLARPGPLADGLLGFLKTIPGVHVVGHLSELPSSNAETAELDPAVVVLAFGTSAQRNLAALTRLDATLPESKCIVVANDIQQQQAAATHGADAVLLNGCRPAELVAAIRVLAAARAACDRMDGSRPLDGAGRS